MSGIKRKRESESDADDAPHLSVKEEENTMDAGSASRSAGRVRKKSAKVLEMEEFEEAEKKQYKKTDSAKKQQNAQPANNPAKKVKVKAEEGEMIKPEKAVKTEEKITSPEQPVIAEPITPSAKKSGKSSVIKLLLSSPAVPTSPAVSTKTVTKSKTAEIKKEPESKGVTASTKKAIKSKVKIKDMTSPTNTLPPEMPLQVDTQVDIKPVIPLTPESLTALTPHSAIYTSMPEIASITPAPGQEGSLKMKLILSPKQESPTPEFSIPQPTPFVKNVKKVKKKKEAPVGVEQTVPVTSSSKSPSEAMPNLAALVNASSDSSPKKKTPKPKKCKKNSDFEFETLGETFDPMDADEEPQLVIADPTQDEEKKKKVSNKVKKKLKSALDGKLESADNGVPSEDQALLSAKIARQKKKKLNSDFLRKVKPKKNKRPPTAYTLWCNAHRTEVLKENPKMDFAQMSRRLGVIWQGLSKKEKMMWKRRAKKLAGKGSTLISTGKLKTSSTTQPTQLLQAATSPDPQSTDIKSPNLTDKVRKPGDDSMAVALQRGLGTDPVDVAAHLKLMGESLCNIGMRLQETKGHMAVQGGLSVLLDSLICACGPLMCLTQQLYELNGCDRLTHVKTLDNIAYIMPGL